MRSNQRQADFCLVSRTNKDAVVFREWHQILRQGKNRKSGCAADLANVLVLLYVRHQAQTCYAQRNNSRLLSFYQ